MQLTLGPLLYYWERADVWAFYEAIAPSAVDVVYLGEAVCSRRHTLRLTDWLDLAAFLRDAGKEVVLSTQVLLESGAEVATMHKIVRNGDFKVEANDMGAVNGLQGKVPFVAGPHLNIYNPPTLQWMASLGATRWVMPLEMTRTDLTHMQQERPASMQTEVFAYGRMPLAFSARCFTARQRNLPKDDCQFSCLEYPDGLMLRTREKADFLVLNGTQTQSAKVYNLIDALADLDNLGVDAVRLSPQSQNMRAVIDVFDDARHRCISESDALARLQPLMPDAACNGYWHGRPGSDWIDTRAHAVAV